MSANAADQTSNFSVDQNGEFVVFKSGCTVASGTIVQAAHNVVLLAEVNAGKTVLPAVPNAKYRILAIRAQAAGAFAALTLLRVMSSEVVVVSYTQAVLLDGSVFTTDNVIVGQTLGAGFNVDLAVNTAITVDKTGSAATTATSESFTIMYQLIPA